MTITLLLLILAAICAVLALILDGPKVVLIAIGLLFAVIAMLIGTVNFS